MENDVGLADGADLGTKDDVAAPEKDSRDVIEKVRAEEDVTVERPEGLPEDLWDAKANDVKKTALVDSYLKEQKRTK